MKLCDKIIKLRRAAALSQEELADRLGVSRQAVSKWESGQSMPDIDKIIALSELFGVSTDYLLKESDSSHFTADEVKEENIFDEEKPQRYKASLDDVKAYLSLKFREAKIIAIAVLLFILSPTGIIALPVLAELGYMSDTLAVLFGIIMIFFLATLGVGLCIYADMLSRGNPINERRDCEFDAAGINYAKEKRREHSRFCTATLIIGVSLCILSPIPLIISAFTSFMPILFTVDILLLVVGIGTAFIVNSQIIEENEHLIINSEKSRKSGKSKAETVVTECYWTLISLAYLLISFLTSRWDISWVIWILAGVASNLIPLFFSKRRK